MDGKPLLHAIADERWNPPTPIASWEHVDGDAGMHPKEDGKAATPRYEDLAHDSVDAIVVSHSHLDHVGTLPVVMEDHPSARVFLTPATYALADALPGKSSGSICYRLFASPADLEQTPSSQPGSPPAGALLKSSNSLILATALRRAPASPSRIVRMKAITAR